MSVEASMRAKLEKTFDPVRLEIVNESHLHAGHAGSPGSGESHFRIVIVAQSFDGQSRVARQRAVNAALADELRGPVHALSAKILSPSEDEDAA